MERSFRNGHVLAFFDGLDMEVTFTPSRGDIVLLKAVRVTDGQMAAYVIASGKRKFDPRAMLQSGWVALDAQAAIRPSGEESQR
jgi:hypothetical protein